MTRESSFHGSGLLISGLDMDQTASTFYMAAISSALLGVFSFVLPDTPPKAKAAVVSTSSALGLGALGLFKDRAYLVFFIAAVLICIPLSFYYTWANPFLTALNIENPTGKQTLGQFSEAIFILAIPFLFNQIGVKKMLILGIVAWLLRYVFFAFGDGGSGLWMAYMGIILHGVCYDFFFVTGYMYTEKKSSDKIKNAAQGLFTLASYGLGMVVGTYVSGFVVDAYTTPDGVRDWHSIWMVPAYISIGVLVFFLLFFKEKKQIETAA